MCAVNAAVHILECKISIVNDIQICCILIKIRREEYGTTVIDTFDDLPIRADQEILVFGRVFAFKDIILAFRSQLYIFPVLNSQIL